MAWGSGAVFGSSMNGVTLPGYSNTYQGAWQGSRDAQQGQISSGTALINQLMAAQAQQIAASNNRYTALQGQVVKGLRGANKANLQDIADKYTALSGQQSQQLIDRGLGNTTIQSSVNRGIASDHAQEATRSKNEFANTVAGYQARLGSQAADAERQGILSNSQLGMGAANWLASIGIGYPDRGSYSDASGAYGSGGGGSYGGAIYPATAGLHRFASDVAPQTYDPYSGGGGGAYFDTPAPQAQQAYGVQSAAGVGQNGEYAPSYATSPQYAWEPSAGNYARAEATY